MKIKSLILGSAAALLAVSGARAADAVMAPEPEPVDYVRVCDAYGAGFFYIPGTETCLSINGYVWFQVGAGSGTAFKGVEVDTGAGTITRVGGNDTPGMYSNDTDGWNTGSRVRINFDARSETELGTLRGWMRLQADWNTKNNTYADVQLGNNDGSVGIDQAFVQLGGFVAGYGDSAWFYQFNNSTLNFGAFSWLGMYYSNQSRQRISYEFGGKNGLYGVISLEDPKDEQSYMPDVVGRIGYSAAWGGAALTVAYDHDRDGADLFSTSEKSAFSIQGSALFNLPSMPGSAIKVMGWYNTADNSYGTGSPLKGIYAEDTVLDVTYKLGQPEWSALASFLYQATPDLAFIVSGQYFSDHYVAGTKDKVSGTSAWAAELEAVWLPVKNFEIRPSIAYTKAEHLDGSVSGYLRFTRYF